MSFIRKALSCALEGGARLTSGMNNLDKGTVSTPNVMNMELLVSRLLTDPFHLKAKPAPPRGEDADEIGAAREQPVGHIELPPCLFIDERGHSHGVLHENEVRLGAELGFDVALDRGFERIALFHAALRSGARP